MDTIRTMRFDESVTSHGMAPDYDKGDIMAIENVEQVQRVSTVHRRPLPGGHESSCGENAGSRPANPRAAGTTPAEDSRTPPSARQVYDLCTHDERIACADPWLLGFRCSSRRHQATKQGIRPQRFRLPDLQTAAIVPFHHWGLFGHRAESLPEDAPRLRCHYT